MRWTYWIACWLSLCGSNGQTSGSAKAQTSSPSDRYAGHSFFFFSVSPHYTFRYGHARQFAHGTYGIGFHFHRRTASGWTAGLRIGLGMTENIGHHPLLPLATADSFVYNGLGLKEPMNIRFEAYEGIAEVSRFIPWRVTATGAWFVRPRLGMGYFVYRYKFDHPGYVPVLAGKLRRGYDYLHGGPGWAPAIGVGRLSQANRLHFEVWVEGRLSRSVFLRQRAYDRPEIGPHAEWDYGFGVGAMVHVLISPP